METWAVQASPRRRETSPGELRGRVLDRGNLWARPSEVAEHSPAQWSWWLREEARGGKGPLQLFQESLDLILGGLGLH